MSRAHMRSRSPDAGAQAADAWVELGRPYEAAFALSQSDDVPTPAGERSSGCDSSVRVPLATMVARRLRERGARDSRAARPGDRPRQRGAADDA